jgi:hypothetical protein
MLQAAQFASQTKSHELTREALDRTEAELLAIKSKANAVGTATTER